MFNIIKNKGYYGVCYDFEIGNIQNTILLDNTFDNAIAANLKIAVTTSGMKPYGISSASAFLQSWINNSKIEYFMPQQYSGGSEYINSITYCNPSILAQFKAGIIPALPSPENYADFKNKVPSASGYSIWYTFSGNSKGSGSGKCVKGPNIGKSCNAELDCGNSQGATPAWCQAA
jgi:hypothetical protein